MTYLRYFNILLVELFLIALPIGAQEVSPMDTDSLITLSDTVAVDSFSPDPEWYVAPEIPLFLRAPKRAAAAAAACTRVEAIQTFNIDSVLTEGTYYEYDAKGNVISTTVWTYNPDGTMTGKSKNEYAFDATGTQTMTAVYIWDGAANDWKGTEKYEYIYQTVAGEKKMISNTSLIWLNGAWVADHRYTYGYDEAGREISYFEYNRNTTTNELQPVLGREQSWTDDLQTLEALYTAYSNGAWSAGTKKIWEFDSDGNQTLYEYYASISNGNWIGDTKETWTYGGPTGQLTLHEKFGWENGWSKTLKEETEYEGSNIVRIENYTFSNGVKTGTKKEEYTFTSAGKPASTITYAWSGDTWVGSTNETWVYNGPSGQQTLHEKYDWAGNDWSLTLQEKTVYSGANITLIENYTWSNGVKTGTKKEEYTYSGSLMTSFVTYSWAGSDWVGASKEIWAYTSGKQTLHETYAWGATDWSITLQENTAYSGANITKIENYTWTNGTKTGTQKEIWAYTSGKQTLHETYAWGATDWYITLQENTAYSGANITKIENYTWTNGTKTGTQKEEYAYTGSQKTQEIIYAWANDVWVETTKEVWGYTSGKLTHHETYIWNGDWSKTLEENTTYDGANITKIENYTYSGGVKTGTQKEEYTYTSGEKTMTVVYAWANNDWVYSTKNEAGYRDGNVEVSATNYAWNGSEWIGTGTRVQTTYNSDQKVTEKLTKNWPSGATDWTNAAITTNTYNADGENIMTYNGTWNGSRWTVYSMTRTDIIFDDAGHQLLRASWRCGSDSVWTGVQKDTAAYTAANLLLYSAQYTSWANNKWVASYRVEYEYDSANRVTLNQRYDWKNNKWQGKYKYEYEYDAQGRQTMSATYSSWNKSTNNWVGSSKKTTEYDNEGRIKSMTTYKWSNNKWLEQYLYSYLYDNTGREIEQIVQFYSGGSWVNMLKYENAYSGNKQTKSNSYSWLNNQWVYSSRSESTYDELSPETLRRQVNGTWAAGSLLSYSDDYYYYNCDPHFYTVRFVNYDGSVLENVNIQEGEMPVYSGETPTKPADTEFTYTFSGWTPNIVAVTSNATYMATFTSVKNKYTITWLNEDGSLIDETTMDYGVMPEHAAATKENTAEYTYTFAGWTPGLGIVTGDATYTATFDSIKNSYTVTWRNDDGSEIDHETLEYGATPTHDDAVKDNTSEWTYSFTGWDPEVVSVVGDAIYTAKFDSVKNSYTITWRNWDLSSIDQTNVEYGATPTHDDAIKDNTAEWTYTFAGWDPEVVSVVGDATYTAMFDSVKNSYTIIWRNWDLSSIDQTTVEYGVAPTHDDATKENTAEWTYTFAGWEPEIVSVTGDATYTAKFDSIKNSYIITWRNSDNSLIDETNVEYGATPTHADAAKEATAEYTYKFTGWEPEIVDVVGDATYTAQFDSVKNSYTITWLNEDNSLIDETTVEYGVIPTHDNPTKDPTTEYIYTFAGWTPEVVAVTGNATYTATFTEHNNQFTITFLDVDGTTLQSSEVEYGKTPVYEGETPAKEATAEWTYNFAGWDPAIVAVMGDATYTAKFDSTKNAYTITWRNWDDSLIDETSVDYGDTPEHNDAVKEATAEWTYTFAGWDPAIVSVIGEATYTAQFDSTKNTYTITWLNADGSEIEHETLEYGATPEHADIEKEATAEWTYSFTGWDPAVLTVIGEATYTAQFDSTKNSYTVTWLNADGSEIEHETLEYGATPAHADIIKENTDEWTYTFAGWDPAIVDVVGDAFYKATFDSVKNTYTITWLNADGSEIEHETLEYGATPAHADIIKENTDEWTYTFAGWDPAIVDVVGDAFYKATFDSVKNSYTITWLNADGSEIDHETLEYGVTPEHEDATKEATDDYTYTFAGWDPAVVIVNGEATYTAQFDSVKNSYTITWLNNDGSEIDQTTEEYGATPDHDDVVKEATAEWTYTFTGWDPAIVSVTGEATYTAQFDSVKNNYTITWLNIDNSLIDQVDVEYGIVPSREDPTKENTAEYTYTFAGWDPEVVAVSENATYTATYDSVKNSYTITWLNWDNSLIDETTVEYGVEPTLDDPTKEATAEWTYTFAGWDPEVIAVIGEATYTATFDSVKNTYTITWLDDQGDEIDQTTEEFGATPTHDDAVKEATAEWTYSFTGWDPAITEVTGEATYTAQFDSTKNSYTVTWLNDDGTELDHETLEYGSTPTHADIDKEATAEWTYTFAGWEPEIVDVVGDATYTAQFDSIKNTYTITWLNWDESLIDQTNVEYGVVPTHDDPTKEATDEWTYNFAGWDPEVIAVIREATYTATFDSVKNTYTITWLNDDYSLIDQTTEEYGATPTHDDAVKEATAEWTYSFIGWDPAITEVTGEATYTAQFDSTKNSYTVTWLNDDGTELDHETLEYGATPTHADIEKENTAEWTYTFVGWEPEIVDVVGDATYTAQFDSVKNTYTITWLNWDNSQIDETIVEYGVEPTHDDPTKEATDEWTYNFTGWDPEVIAVTGEATYTAQFDSVKNTYTITWLNDDNSLIDQTDVEYGATPEHDDAVKEATAEWTYTFTGWDPAITEVTGETTYTAQFDSTKNSYTITWLNADGSEIEHETLEYGATPTHADIDKEATAEWTYTFVGWEPEIVDVVGDATYTAQFDSVKNSYTITWLNWDNSLIDQTNVEYGVMPTHEDPTKAETEKYSYTFAGWDPEVIAVIGEATYTATFDSVKNTYTITWLNDDNSLIDQTDVEYGATPDHDDAVKEATAEWTYTFTDWDPAITEVTGEATYTAQFDSTKNSYTVTWLNNDGSEIDHETLEYGSTPTHADIDKEATAEWTYTFTGWDPEIVDVVGDATYTAQFDSIKNSYTITWLNWDNSLIDQTNVEYGVMPTHEDPTKAETEKYSYTFAGWEPEVVAVIGDATYTATFDSTETTIYYHISITVDDAAHGKAGFVYADSESSTLLTDNEVASGTWIELRAIASDDWHFDHWSDGDTASVRPMEVTEDMQFTAYFASNCGDYPTLPVVSLYDWLLMLDVRSIHAMGYTFSEEDVVWYHVNGEPDKESDGAQADDERLGTGYSFTLNESLINSGDYYATVDVSSSPAGRLCPDMMRSKIVHFASTRAAMPPMLTPALVRPSEPQHILRLDPEFPTTVTIYDLSGHLLRTFSEEGVDRMELQAESVAGSYQVVVQNGDLRTVLRYIVVQ